jgi:ribosome-associated toxin RatA of RatAB toxin-antitoxin module
MADASKSIEINCSTDHFFSVLTDFEKYPQFVSDLKGVTVLKHEDNVFHVKYRVNIIKDIEYTLRLESNPPKTMTWKLVDGQMMKDNSGRWEIEKISDSRIRATYVIYLKLSGFIPSAVTNKLAELSLPKMLNEFKERAEKTFK